MWICLAVRLKAKIDRIEKEKDGLVDLDDEEFLMEEYESEGDEEGGKSKRKGNGFSISSSSEEEDELNCEGEESLKVYFCSRTHSQLSQFIKELRKTVFGSKLKVVSLGSKKNLCINVGMCCLLIIQSFQIFGFNLIGLLDL